MSAVRDSLSAPIPGLYRGAAGPPAFAMWTKRHQHMPSQCSASELISTIPDEGVFDSSWPGGGVAERKREGRHRRQDQAIKKSFK